MIYTNKSIFKIIMSENKTNIKVRKQSQRKSAIEQGFYDGRFKTKSEILKKFKKIKYKKDLFSDLI